MCAICTGFLRKIGEDDILYKPVQPGVRGSVEVQFYESVFGSTDLPLEVINLRELVPNYYGRETIRDRAGQLRILITLTFFSLTSVSLSKGVTGGRGGGNSTNPK